MRNLALLRGALVAGELLVVAVTTTVTAVLVTMPPSSPCVLPTRTSSTLPPSSGRTVYSPALASDTNFACLDKPAPGFSSQRRGRAVGNAARGPSDLAATYASDFNEDFDALAVKDSEG